MLFIGFMFISLWIQIVGKLLVYFVLFLKTGYLCTCVLSKNHCKFNSWLSFQRLLYFYMLPKVYWILNVCKICQLHCDKISSISIQASSAHQTYYTLWSICILDNNFSWLENLPKRIDKFQNRNFGLNQHNSFQKTCAQNIYILIQLWDNSLFVHKKCKHCGRNISMIHQHSGLEAKLRIEIFRPKLWPREGHNFGFQSDARSKPKLMVKPKPLQWDEAKVKF